MYIETIILRITVEFNLFAIFTLLIYIYNFTWIHLFEYI